MNPKRARQFVTELAMVMGAEVSGQRLEWYVEALAEADDRLAEAAFHRLVRKAHKFPTIADILDAFQAEAEEVAGTREVRRSAPSPERRAKDQVAIARWMQFEPVCYYPDLYAGYVQALREYREGARSLDELRQVRVAVIAEALRRDEDAHSSHAGKPNGAAVESHPSLSGLDASLPKGDR